MIIMKQVISILVESLLLIEALILMAQAFLTDQTDIQKYEFVIRFLPVLKVCMFLKRLHKLNLSLHLNISGLFKAVLNNLI